MVALVNEVTQRTLLRVLRKEKYHPYKIQLVHKLIGDNYDERQQFSETIIELQQQIDIGIGKNFFRIRSLFEPGNFQLLEWDKSSLDGQVTYSTYSEIN